MYVDPGSSAFLLRGDSVVVRDFVASDESDFVEWANHDEMYGFMVWRLDSRAAAIDYFRGLLSHPERTAEVRRHWYLAVINSDDQFCGIAGFDVRRDGLGEFGWYLSPAFWGRGYATEITSLFLRFGFDQLELRAIEATCDPANNASRRVLEKAGLSVVGEVETVGTWQGERPRLRLHRSGCLTKGLRVAAPGPVVDGPQPRRLSLPGTCGESAV